MNKNIIICTPVSFSSSFPKGEKDCEKLPCPECDELMWVSENKKLLFENFTSAIMICSVCFAENYIEDSDDNNYIEIDTLH